MAKINMDTEPRFKELMKQFDFKKKKNWFVRRYEDAIQELDFCYATYGQKHVRYYYEGYAIQFPEVDKIAEIIGEHIYGLQGLGGYLMPQASDVEWRLSEEDSDEYYLKMIHEISDATKDYVLPFLNKYSNLREYTYGVEMGLFKHTTYDYKTPPIAYYLLGEKDNALRYIDQMLNLYAHRIESEKKKYELIEKDSFREEVFYCGYNRDYDNYKEFADKFIKYMEEKDKQL